MKAFQLIPSIAEYPDFAALAGALSLGPADLILTNEYIYNPTIASLDLGCHTCFQEKYGAGEPTDVMVDAILNDLRDKDYDRIVAVGGGTVIDIAKVLTVARPSDKVDDLYDRMGSLEKEHPLIIVPTTCGTGSEVTNISIINRTTKGVKVGLVSPAMFADEAGGARTGHAPEPSLPCVCDQLDRRDGACGGELPLPERLRDQRAVLGEGAAAHPARLEGSGRVRQQGRLEGART